MPLSPEEQAQRLYQNGGASSYEAALALINGSGGGSSGANDPNNNPIYFPPLGVNEPFGYPSTGRGQEDEAKTTPPSAVRGEHSGSGGGTTIVEGRRTNNISTQGAAMYWLQEQYNNHTQAYQDIRQKMIEGGMMSKNGTILDALDVWKTMVGLSVSTTQHGGEMSPLDYLNRFWKDGVASGAGGPKTTTADSRQTQYSREQDVAGVYQNIAQQELGRRASDSEVAGAYSSVHAAQAAAPSISHQVQVVDAQGNSTTTGTGTDALGAQGINEMLTQQAMGSSDYGAYQAAGHYFPALLQALGAVNSAGA